MCLMGKLSDVEMLTYFYGPIGVLLFVNIILFASTARQLTCGLWKRDDVKSTTERAALGRVCLKLVVVMGVTWIADVISWAVGGPNYLWYVTDFINALQGVFIFIVVGCQPQVWAAVKRICGTKSNRSVMNTTNGPQHSSSSHGLPSMGDTVTNNTLPTIPAPPIKSPWRLFAKMECAHRGDFTAAALGRVCLKLVVVMGVTWIADVISWAVGGPNYLWYVTDFINALQGVFIFIVVGCQPQVWAAVKRICGTKSNRSVMNTTNGPQHSSSSHGLPSMGDTVTNNTFTNNTSTTNKVPMETVC
uniref:G-protein coupled receptor Mth-like 1 n=1 Tax=Lutzomyia longipalpis TaxID=7200 RepID=A0A1B0EWR8_LUTLO